MSANLVKTEKYHLSTLIQILLKRKIIDPILIPTNIPNNAFFIPDFILLDYYLMRNHLFSILYKNKCYCNIYLNKIVLFYIL